MALPNTSSCAVIFEAMIYVCPQMRKFLRPGFVLHFARPQDSPLAKSWRKHLRALWWR